MGAPKPWGGLLASPRAVRFPGDFPAHPMKVSAPQEVSCPPGPVVPPSTPIPAGRGHSGGRVCGRGQAGPVTQGRGGAGRQRRRRRRRLPATSALGECGRGRAAPCCPRGMLAPRGRPVGPGRRCSAPPWCGWTRGLCRFLPPPGDAQLAPEGMHCSPRGGFAPIAPQMGLEWGCSALLCPAGMLCPPRGCVSPGCFVSQLVTPWRGCLSQGMC